MLATLWSASVFQSEEHLKNYKRDLVISTTGTLVTASFRDTLEMVTSQIQQVPISKISHRARAHVDCQAPHVA